MSNTDEELTNQYNAYVEDNLKFLEKKNKAAGTRARKALMEITKLCKARRKEIQEAKNAE
jgi:hypothetical protein